MGVVAFLSYEVDRKLDANREVVEQEADVQCLLALNSLFTSTEASLSFISQQPEEFRDELMLQWQLTNAAINAICEDRADTALERVDARQLVEDNLLPGETIPGDD